MSPSPAEPDSHDVQDPDQALRSLLRREVESALARSEGALPLGKWLEADLVLAADRVTEGVARRAAASLGMADTTYRRRLSKAERERRGGLDVRTESWKAVRQALEHWVRRHVDSGRPLDDQASQWLLQTIRELCVGNPRTGAALLGVTEQTYLRRLNACPVSPSMAPS